MSSLVNLAASVLRYRAENIQTNGGKKNSTSATAVGVGHKITLISIEKVNAKRIQQRKRAQCTSVRECFKR